MINQQDIVRLEQNLQKYAATQIKELSEYHHFNAEFERDFINKEIKEQINDMQSRSDESIWCNYDFYFKLYKNWIDNYYNGKQELLTHYEEMYYKDESEQAKFNYDTLLAAVNSILPNSYKNEPVKIHYFEQPFSHRELNFNPYKNKGQLLPSYFAYTDKRTGGELYCSKGETFIIEQLYYINKHKDYDNIAPLFIFTVLSDYGYYLQNDSLDSSLIDRFAKQSKDLLIRNGYDAPHHRCKKFVIPRYNKEAKSYFHNFDANAIHSEQELALFIVTVLDLSLQSFNMEYFTYPKQEHERANQIMDEAMERYGEWLSSVIKLHNN